MSHSSQDAKDGGAADDQLPRPARVAITGGGGHLGRELVRQLEAIGTVVVPLQRGTEEMSRWPLLCRDIDVVVHLAAPTVDVDAVSAGDALGLTYRLFEALPRSPLAVVFAGSMALFRPPLEGNEIDEQSAMYQGEELTTQDAYTRMKASQEQLVRASCLARGDRLTILRPSNVWDEERWLQACVGPKAGPLWFVVDPGRRLRLIHRVNCARVFVDAVRAGRGGTDEFNVDDGAVISAWRYATRVTGWRRHGYLPVPVAGWLFDAVTSLGAFALRVAAPRKRVPGLLIAQRRAARFGRYHIDTRHVRERLGWQPDLGPYEPRSTPA